MLGISAKAGMTYVQLFVSNSFCCKQLLFFNTGVDYFGPFQIPNRKIRKRDEVFVYLSRQ